jgi:molybdate/tungstate transport system substrate-binding protein
LAVPFTAVIDAFKRANPAVTVASRFAGSVELVRGVTQLKEPVDVLGVADASLIPAQMFGTDGAERFADWAVGFASNQITFAYTDQSAGAGELTPTNWYQVLARPGVKIGRSNPDTDPSGYQVLQMLSLAQDYYHEPTLSASVLANSPAGTLVNTETSLLPALQAGQIDYLAVYRSDALQHHLHFIDLPSQINLADPAMASSYATVSVTTASGVRTGKPIVYGLTIPTDAPNPAAAQAFLAFVLGPEGQQIMRDNGFVTITPATVTGGPVPPALGPLTTPQITPSPSPR